MKIVSHKIGFHKDVFKPSLLKSTAVFLVFVFAWTNMGIYQVVYAATTEHTQNTKIPAQPFPESKVSGTQSGIQGSAQSLEKTLKDIEDTVTQTQKSSNAAELKSNQQRFAASRDEIAGLDAQMQNQFKQTEARIKSLPSVIMQRQKAFEKRYEQNLKQLKASLDSVSNAKTTSELTVRAKQLKTFLDKIQPPQRHVKLNPNKLPHRSIG
jgi:chromosome segregation ATPase